ncbi:leucine-rich repeat-containing protein 47-like isoform X1 [Anneissia japonica]|uniref:leucine-rich repeat-containing protein 47-like isoform X1 n=1 Tax=Anneissia japonica TaxID=1529436 RepID=UPI0014259511|nr:leucine-rich repeat-containing protein 47-like isoform X1 [Anneissia japonica]
MAANVWEETVRAKKENRRELVLSGNQISSRIDDGGLDDNIFNLKMLNFLEISNTSLTFISEKIGLLSSMVNLVLRGNKLDRLPPSLGQLHMLKLLDVSGNSLSVLPFEINELTNLQSIDASNNLIYELPDMKRLNKLAVVNFAGNKLKSIEPLFSNCFAHLSDLIASANAIELISGNIDQLEALKKLDLHENVISELPVELGSCPKLKECLFQNNKFKDRRLDKLVKQCKTKAILDYVRANGKKGTKTRSTDNEEDGFKLGKGKKLSKKREKETALLKTEKNIKVLPLADCPTSNIIDVVVTKHTAIIRPYIVCCVVRNIDLERGSNFKQFLAAQTKLHDALCAKRTKATIATHDLALIKTPVKFDAIPPAVLKIIPLGKQKEETALTLVSRLNKEADELQKKMKRSSVSGVHKPAPESVRLSDFVFAAKGWSRPTVDETNMILYDSFIPESPIYLDLLKDKQLYPCVTNADDQVISFPPITNSDISKISPQTKDVFIEVTSSTDLNICKQVMDTLLKAMLDIKMGGLPTNQHENIMKIGNIDIQSPDDGATCGTPHQVDMTCHGNDEPVAFDWQQRLNVQQVKIVDTDGNLKVLYPSRVDLKYDEQDVCVDRPMS